MGFEVGDKVKWTSQSSGYTKEKVGEVVAVIPPNKFPARETRHPTPPGRILAMFLGENWDDKYNTRPMGGGYSRPQESYLVAVPQKRPESRRLLYWPYAELLEKVE